MAQTASGLANGLRAGYEKHKGALIGSGIAPEIKSQIIADAANYAVKHFPDATKHFGVEKPEQLADLAAALLPKIEAERPIAPTSTDTSKLQGNSINATCRLPLEQESD